MTNFIAHLVYFFKMLPSGFTLEKIIGFLFILIVCVVLVTLLDNNSKPPNSTI